MAAHALIIDGPYSGAVVPLEEPLRETIGLGVSSDLEPDPSQRPFALACYRLDSASRYRLLGFQRPDRQPFVIAYSDGPAKGERPSPQPIQMLPVEQRCPLDADGRVMNLDGVLASVAIYERDQRDADWKYYFKRIDDSPEALAEAKVLIKEQLLTDMINRFYQKPNYDIYSMKPTGRHVQVSIQVGHRKGEVDERLVPLIKEVWRLGLDTMGSCQDRPEGHRFAGLAYIWFPRLQDARRFEELLKNAGIECVFDPKQCGVKREKPLGRDDDKAMFENANIVFAPSDIERITELLRGKVEL